MLRLILPMIVSLLLLLQFVAGAAKAESMFDYFGKCTNPKEAFDLVPKVLSQGDFSVFQLEKEYGQKYLAFTGLGVPSQVPLANWYLVGRKSEETSEYCMQGIGQISIPLRSLHETKFVERYGMPESGYDRCSKIDDPLGSVKVRAWASRELGESFILSLSGSIEEGVGFTILISKLDGAWILLKRQATGENCYFDRGPTSATGSFSTQ